MYLLDALKAAGVPREDGFPAGTLIEWTDEPSHVIYTGRVIMDYDHGTTIRVEAVRLAQGSYETWVGSAHHGNFRIVPEPTTPSNTVRATNEILG